MLGHNDAAVLEITHLTICGYGNVGQLIPNEMFKVFCNSYVPGIETSAEQVNGLVISIQVFSCSLVYYIKGHSLKNKDEYDRVLIPEGNTVYSEMANLWGSLERYNATLDLRLGMRSYPFK